MKWIWTTFLYQPLYNALIFFVVIIPGHSLAISIIILTLIVRLVLSPLSKRATVSQIRQKELQPEIEEIRQNVKDSKKQSEALLAVYKKNKLNPLSGFFLILLQLPIILALYHVFQGGAGNLPDLLYPFVQYPESINISIFNIIDLSKQSVILAILAGVAQYIQLKFSPSFSKAKNQDPKNNQEKTVQSIQKKMVFTMPIVIAVFAYMLPSAIALYWMISNLYTLGQEIVIRKNLEKKKSREENISE